MTGFEVEDKGLETNRINRYETALKVTLWSWYCIWNKWSWEKFVWCFCLGLRSSNEEMLLSRRKTGFSMCQSGKIQKQREACYTRFSTKESINALLRILYDLVREKVHYTGGNTVSYHTGWHQHELRRCSIWFGLYTFKRNNGFLSSTSQLVIDNAANCAALSITSCAQCSSFDVDVLTLTPNRTMDESLAV